jgi:hypothetical protein
MYASLFGAKFQIQSALSDLHTKCYIMHIENILNKWKRVKKYHGNFI